jgi:hypothetical protein
LQYVGLFTGGFSEKSGQNPGILKQGSVKTRSPASDVPCRAVRKILPYGGKHRVLFQEERLL